MDALAHLGDDMDDVEESVRAMKAEGKDEDAITNALYERMSDLIDEVGDPVWITSAPFYDAPNSNS